MSSLPLKRPKMDDASILTSLIDLPDEILEIIFLKIPVHDVQWNLARVCKRFLQISRYPDMVKNISLSILNLKVTRLHPTLEFELKFVDACDSVNWMIPYEFHNKNP